MACLCIAAACGSDPAPKDPFVTQGTGHWEPTASAPADATYVTQIFWTGKEVLLPSAGGLFEYDPVASRWAPLRGPAFDYWYQNNVKSVWTGQSVISFGDSKCGGSSPAPSPCQVGVTDEVQTSQFKNLNLQGAPSSRDSCDVVWTGTRLFVWGGRHLTFDSSYNVTDFHYDDGGLYDPIADTWAPIPSSKKSPPRGAESVVWTGSEVLMWGGEMLQPMSTSLASTLPVSAASVPAISGAAYNPVTDTWRAMSTAGQPSPRSGHAAIWTGTEMIIWGGGAYPNPDYVDSYLADGAAYNPATDQWRRIQSAPDTGLYRPAVIWTGSEMIVWGGSDKYGEFSNRGYRYTSATDSWQYMTTVGAPRPRVDPGGAWTGRSLAVLGGIVTGILPASRTDGAQWFPEAADGG
ncbi:MAG: hypothetical protein ACREJ3_02140 [Polyangiaceae bacterium]